MEQQSAFYTSVVSNHSRGTHDPETYAFGPRDVVVGSTVFVQRTEDISRHIAELSEACRLRGVAAVELIVTLLESAAAVNHVRGDTHIG
jgi:hypothetical protein